MSEILARLGAGEKEVQLQRSLVDGKRSYELIVNGVFIMASYNDLSSRELVRLPLREQDWQGCRPAVLVAGLGNRAITPDALGPRTAEGFDLLAEQTFEPEQAGGGIPYLRVSHGQPPPPGFSAAGRAPSAG